MSEAANAQKNRRRAIQARRLVFARQSMTLAIEGCEFAITNSITEYLRAILAAGSATFYASPFTEANELGRLEDEFLRFENPQFAATHRETITFRNQLYAHRDLSVMGTRIGDGLTAPMHFIDISITAHGTASVSGSLIQWPPEAFVKLKALCEFQRNRLQKKEIKLIRQIAQHVKKPPGTYRLGIDFP